MDFLTTLGVDLILGILVVVIILAFLAHGLNGFDSGHPDPTFALQTNIFMYSSILLFGFIYYKTS